MFGSKCNFELDKRIGSFLCRPLVLKPSYVERPSTCIQYRGGRAWCPELRGTGGMVLRAT